MVETASRIGQDATLWPSTNTSVFGTLICCIPTTDVHWIPGAKEENQDGPRLLYRFTKQLIAVFKKINADIHDEPSLVFSLSLLDLSGEQAVRIISTGLEPDDNLATILHAQGSVV